MHLSIIVNFSLILNLQRKEAAEKRAKLAEEQEIRRAQEKRKKK
jgi:hypothetical protein